MKLHADIGTGQPGQFFHLDPVCARTLDTMHDAHFVLCYEHHAQDSRVRGPIFVAQTFGSSNANSMGVSGNNPLIVQRWRASNG